MENSIFSDFLCPPACDSQNESLYNVDKNLNGTFELHCILKFEKKCNFGRFGHIWCTKSKINVSKISFSCRVLSHKLALQSQLKEERKKVKNLLTYVSKKLFIALFFPSLDHYQLNCSQNISCQGPRLPSSHITHTNHRAQQ